MPLFAGWTRRIGQDLSGCHNKWIALIPLYQLYRKIPPTKTSQLGQKRRQKSLISAPATQYRNWDSAKQSKAPNKCSLRYNNLGPPGEDRIQSDSIRSQIQIRILQCFKQKRTQENSSPKYVLEEEMGKRIRNAQQPQNWRREKREKRRWTWKITATIFGDVEEGFTSQPPKLESNAYACKCNSCSRRTAMVISTAILIPDLPGVETWKWGDRDLPKSQASCFKMNFTKTMRG